MLRIAIQAKGRLNEDSSAMLRELGIDIDEGKRKFLSQSPNFPIELLYMRDDDIPGVVAGGTAQLGIVGLNEVVEKGCPVQVVERLGFGGCRISLAIPKAESYEGPSWFEGKRIATSYPGILRQYLDKQGITAQIEIITGSVEIAPAAGIADAIFDIVSSGGTLVSNGLVEVASVLRSEAVLIARPGLPAEKQALLERILFRFDAALESRGKKYLLMNIPTDRLQEAFSLLQAMRSPTVMPLAIPGWSSVHSVVEEASLWQTVERLKAIGAEGILVLNVDKIID